MESPEDKAEMLMPGDSADQFAHLVRLALNGDECRQTEFGDIVEIPVADADQSFHILHNVWLTDDLWLTEGRVGKSQDVLASIIRESLGCDVKSFLSYSTRTSERDQLGSQQPQAILQMRLAPIQE